MNKFKNYINNEWVSPESNAYYQVMNPGDSSDILGEFPLSTENDVSAAIDAAYIAFEEWGRTLPDIRARYVRNFLSLLEPEVNRIGEVLCREQGKVIGESIGEVSRAAKEGQFILGEASRLQGISLPSERQNVTNTVVRVPIGVIAAITPWNFPFLTPIRKILPALIAGCTVVFKPAYDTPMCAIELIKLIEQAGFPKGVVNMVIGKGSTIGDAISTNAKINGITFTGSTVIGRRINTLAASNFTKMQLEMGGKNPALIANFSDLEFAADQICTAAFANAGQRCTAISRVVVTEPLANSLIKQLEIRIKKYKVGFSFDRESQIGPVINKAAGESILSYIQNAQREGATVAIGGKKLSGEIYEKGFYIEPTLIIDVTPDMQVAREEVFGPVLSVIKVKDFEEGLRVCNNTEYGLASAVFTDSQSNIFEFMSRSESGMVHINHGSVSESFMPFGGVKRSGFGSFGIGVTNKDFYTTWKVIYNQYKHN